MEIVKSIAKYLRIRPSFVTAQELGVMADNRRFKDVVELGEQGRAEASDLASYYIGYCHYQLTNYEDAIVHLRKAPSISPVDYYASLFLGNCYDALNRKTEALAQYLQCLERHPEQARDILSQLLPLAGELTDQTLRESAFQRVEAVIGKDSASPHYAKLLFYQRRDRELTADVLKGNLVYGFSSARELASAGQIRLLNVGATERLRFVHLEDNSEVWVDTCEPYVAEVPDARIASGSSLIQVGDRILSDVLADKQYGRYGSMQHDRTVMARRDDAILMAPILAQHEIEEGIMLCGLASNAYGHWFAEFLPKLRYFEQHPRFAELPIIIDEGMPQSHYDFLAALVSNPTYRLAKGTSLRVKNLFIAPADTFFPLELVTHHKVPVERQSNLTIGALKYIGEKIRARYGAPESPNARIFLSRRKSQWRRLVDEADIISDLKNLGFEVVYSEDYTFEEQVKLFQQAEFIVAPNGSALNNLIFSSPQVKVLLLGQKNLFNWGGWFGSFYELGYSPVYLGGEWFGDKEHKHADYTIPVSTVRAKVMEMLGS